MADSQSANEVEEGDDYYHVRFRNPDDFEDIRTPDWAERPASSVVEGSEVRMGDEEGNEEWEVQSVLVPLDAVGGESDARDSAQEIVEKIES